MTIILGGDSLNKAFFLKEQDARNLFFFHKSRKKFRTAAMSGATSLTVEVTNQNYLPGNGVYSERKLLFGDVFNYLSVSLIVPPTY